MHVIKWSRHGAGFIAWLGDNKNKWEYGDTPTTAIAKIVLTYQQELNIKINECRK